MPLTSLPSTDGAQDDFAARKAIVERLEATGLLKREEATRAIPVIALTALAMKGDEERIRAAGCDGYIAKPIRYQDLLAKLTEQLAQLARS